VSYPPFPPGSILASCCLSVVIVTLDQIYEVRQGQQTEAFKKFPYEETFSRSFSVIYEEQRRVVSCKNIWNHLIFMS
jgi:hypothetical protein